MSASTVAQFDVYVPPPTTVRQPLFDIGRCLGQAILSMINRPRIAIDVRKLSMVVRALARRIV